MNDTYYSRLSEERKKEKAEAHRKRIAKYMEADPDYCRKGQLKAKFGITIEDFDRMLIEQGGVCRICKTDKPGGRWNRFHVDHCHETGKVRGLLCNNCNRGLGLLNTESKLANAIKYLERSNEHQ